MKRKRHVTKLVESAAEKEARLARISEWFDVYCRIHNTSVERLAKNANIPPDNIYKWMSGISKAPHIDTIIKLIRYTEDLSGVFSLLYPADLTALLYKMPDISHEERNILERWRKLPDTKRQLFDALIVAMLIEDAKE